MPGVLEAVIRALAGTLTSGDAQLTQLADPVGDRPLMDLEETAGLLGVSRMTVACMADEGDYLPWSYAGDGCRRRAGSRGVRGPDCRGRLRGRTGGHGGVCSGLALIARFAPARRRAQPSLVTPHRSVDWL